MSLSSGAPIKAGAPSAFRPFEGTSSWACAPPPKRARPSARKMLSEGLVALYNRCSHGRFVWDGMARPRRCLTKGGPGPNVRQDLIMHVGDVLGGSGSRATYVVEDLLGCGTFGQVARCKKVVDGQATELVAVKVVRNKPAYSRQGMVEIEIVEHLNKSDYDDRHHLVRMTDYFVHKGHVCIVFELLSLNLYELLKSNNYRGLSTTLVRVFLTQLLDACTLLRRNSILHCDLKPENILLASAAHALIKVIDFGSACYENHTSFSYIQSRFYRAPEVLLGLPYGPDIDMWSVGCITAELYLGLPLFAGTSELAQLRLIMECCGPFPSHMLLAGTKVRRFFDVDGLTFTLKSDAQFSAENNVPPRKPNRRYFEFSSVEQLVMRYPQPATSADLATRQSLAHLLGGMLNLDPMERWTPAQAARHPFVTGEPWEPGWRPPRRAMGALFDDSPSPSPRTTPGTTPGSTPRFSRSSSDVVGESPPRRMSGLPFPDMSTPSTPARGSLGAAAAAAASSSHHQQPPNQLQQLQAAGGGAQPRAVAESDSESEDDWPAADAAHMAASGLAVKSKPMAVPQHQQQHQQQQRQQRKPKKQQPMLGMTPSERSVRPK